jgi:7-cyano-7-deazaguanine synthase
MSSERISSTGALVLLSGGMDSTALAAWIRPSATLFIDYGQRPAAAERRAAQAVAKELSLPFNELSIDLSVIGSGLLVEDDTSPAASQASPSPEWWPLRNQLLCTIAAAWALKSGLDTVLVASVAGDGKRHVDGTAEFYKALDTVTSMQEGAVRVLAPAVDLEPNELVNRAGVTESVLGWTHSCHRSNVPCAACPGCWKREQVLSRLGMLGFGSTTTP